MEFRSSAFGPSVQIGHLFHVLVLVLCCFPKKSEPASKVSKMFLS